MTTLIHTNFISKYVKLKCTPSFGKTKTIAQNIEKKLFLYSRINWSGFMLQINQNHREHNHATQKDLNNRIKEELN